MKKSTLMLCICLLLSVALGVGGTLAYLTDTDAEINVFTMGDVDIDLTEDFQQGSTLIPGVDIEKKPVITNTGDNDAWVWMTWSIPAALDNWNPGNGQEGSNKNIIHWNITGSTHEGSVTIDRVNKALQDGILPEGTTYEEIVGQNKTWDVLNNKLEQKVTIDGVEYNTYVMLYNKELEPGETTLPSAYKVFMDPHVDINPEGDLFWVEAGVATPISWNVNEDGAPKIYVNAYAIQTDGFENVDDAFVGYMGQWSTDGKTITPAIIEAGLTKFAPTTSWSDNADTSWYDASATTYEISTAAELAGLAELVNGGNNMSGKTVKLTADINLGQHVWTPIGQTGKSYGATAYFQGTFDGNGKTISDLYITETNEGNNYAAGFFGFLDCGMTNEIKNFTIKGAVVNGHHWTGAAAGYLSGSMVDVTVEDATITCTHANSEACGDKAGAVVGYINGTQGKMTNCVAKNSTVTAGRDAGQVVGTAGASQVVNCSADNVTVTAGGDCTGANIRNEVIGRLN